MSLGRLLAEGGWPMIPLYLCSVAALAVFMRTWLQFRAARLGDLDWLDAVLEPLGRGDQGAARASCDRAAHPAARAIAAALEVMPTRPDRAAAEAARVGSLELQALERHLGTLSLIAQIAPLLGLLGTVIGLVGLFMDLERSGQAAAAVSGLSSGIWTALLTTAAGLVIAVPALAGHSYLAGRADRLRLAMHDAVERVLTRAPPGTSPGTRA